MVTGAPCMRELPAHRAYESRPGQVRAAGVGGGEEVFNQSRIFLGSPAKRLNHKQSFVPIPIRG